MSDKKEYIERGALMEEIRKHIETIGANAERLVARFPAADVEPVVRGEWIWNAPYMVCSSCKRHSINRFRAAYCQHCGAKMVNPRGAHMERSDPRAETNQVDRCTTCDNNGKPICSSCIMTGHGNDIDFYRAATEPKGDAT